MTFPSTADESAAGATTTRLRTRDRVLGAVGGIMILLAIFLLVAGGERDTGRAPAARSAPELEILEPLHGEEVSGPLRIVFRLPATLRRSTAGWSAGDLHLHLEIDGREYMPGARDISLLPGGGYAWTLPGLPPGPRTLRLFWAGPDHRPMEAGASRRVQVRAR